MAIITNLKGSTMGSKNFSELNVKALTLAEYRKIDKTLTRPYTGTMPIQKKNISNFGNS